MLSPTPAVDVSSLRRKVAWRVLPIAFLLYIASYLDRANIAFAKLRMAGDLKFSDGVFGQGIGIFFLGYLILGIPGALIVERLSARKLFVSILITWGIISASTAFVRTPAEFYLARFILGIAEAAFFPGIIVYFTHWFLQGDRAKAISGLLMAIPLSLALGAPLSALMLDLKWLGLAGWQWIFLLEGLPAVLLGVVVFYRFSDRPCDAKWLTAQERDYLESALRAEARLKDQRGRVSVTQAMRHRNVLLLGFGILAANSGGYALGFWLPTTLKSLSGGSDQLALLYSCLFYSCGLISVLVSGKAADRSGVPKWNCAGGMLATGLFLSASVIPGQAFPLRMAWLCMTALAGYSWATPFWTLPTLALSSSAAAVAIGLINMAANLAGYLGNYAMGRLRMDGFGDSSCLVILAACFVIGAALVSFVHVRREPTAGEVGAGSGPGLSQR
jgi:MFS transporter, ACS family, tartrate transporter